MNKELLKKKLDIVFENFKAAISSHTDINKKRADGGWSVGEIGNHIVKSTQIDLNPTKNSDRPYDQYATSIRDLFLNFQLKFPAMPQLRPEPKTYSVGGLFSDLDRNKENIFNMIDKDDLTEICVDIQLPVWGALTKYEWLVLFESHIIRHTKQVTDFNTVAPKV